MDKMTSEFRNTLRLTQINGNQQNSQYVAYRNNIECKVDNFTKHGDMTNSPVNIILMTVFCKKMVVTINWNIIFTIYYILCIFYGHNVSSIMHVMIAVHHYVTTKCSYSHIIMLFILRMLRCNFSPLLTIPKFW